MTQSTKSTKTQALEALSPSLRRWLSEMGRKGGSQTSKAKAAAARENGRKGGRPPSVRSCSYCMNEKHCIHYGRLCPRYGSHPNFTPVSRSAGGPGANRPSAKAVKPTSLRAKRALQSKKKKG